MAQLTVTVEQIGPSTSRATVRSHQCLVDRPTAKGGEDRGPLGGEYLLLSLAGCFMSNVLAAARARDLVVADLTISAVATIGESPERVTSAALSLGGHDDKEQLRKLATIAERSCIVTNTLKMTMPITVEIE